MTVEQHADRADWRQLEEGKGPKEARPGFGRPSTTLESGCRDRRPPRGRGAYPNYFGLSVLGEPKLPGVPYATCEEVIGLANSWVLECAELAGLYRRSSTVPCEVSVRGESSD